MVVGAIPESVDLLVVGGGPGGYTAAMHAAELGRQVTLVDRDEWGGGLGGTCLHAGCIPSKALIELAESRHRAAGGTAGLTAKGIRLDLAEFQGAKRDSCARLAAGVGGLMERHGVTCMTGELRFTAPRQAIVTTRSEEQPVHLEFADVIVATGSRPAELPVDLALDAERVLDSAAVLSLDHLPKQVVIAGGGYIGLELGTALAKLGVRVTVVEALDRLLPGFDRDVARVIAKSLERLSVAVELGATIKVFEDQRAVIEVGGEERSLEAEYLIAAVGRIPNTSGLGLSQLGIETEASGHIPVDASLRASAHVAAIGDVVSGPALAHKASSEARVAAEALTVDGHRGAVAQVIPEVMFTDPEVAAVGLTAEAAKSLGMEVEANTFPVSGLGRAATIGRTDGFTRLVTERESGVVVGAQMVGPHASETVAEATLAVEMGATAEDLGLVIHAHPTMSEGIAEAANIALHKSNSPQGDSNQRREVVK